MSIATLEFVLGLIKFSTIATCSFDVAYLLRASSSFTSNIKIISCVLVGRTL